MNVVKSWHRCLGPIQTLALFAILIAVAPAPARPEAPGGDMSMIIGIAADGNEGAQVQVALHYLNGSGGFPVNPPLAAQWFERAAIQGNAYAELRLGDLYEGGLGVARNLNVAADWREKAAKRGNTQAQLLLGRMYLVGSGVVRSPAQARYWLERAAVEGNADARRELDDLDRDEVPRQRPEENADGLLAKSAAHGYEQAVNLVHLLDYPEFRIEEAWYRRVPELHKVAEDGDLEAQYVIGTQYLEGSYGKTRNVASAVAWFKRAAEGGHRRAARALARMYEQGSDGLAVDRQLAQYWAARAATPGP